MSTTTTAAPGVTRRFEFVGGTSRKFWEVSIQASEVTVRFGRIGTTGQTQRKSFPHPTLALNYREQVIREKLAKGYVEGV